MQDHALCWLMSSYEPEPRGTASSVFEFFPQFQNDISNQNHVLGSIVSAVGLAGIAGVSFAPDLMTTARRNYDRALVQMRVALQDPVVAKSDQILLSVLLFGLYEVSQL